MNSVSRRVVSNQSDVHPDLGWRVSRAMANSLQKPIAAHTHRAFLHAKDWLASQGLPLVLDAGCGVGLSTRKLARACPERAVIGVDRSADRLGRDHGPLPDNALLVRADLVDFWRLAHHAGWAPVRHLLLYPNPYPKASHLKMRWQAHPVLPSLLALGGELELRTNWQLYAAEFAAAVAQVTGRQGQLASLDPGADYLTPFEAKYHRSGQALWQYKVTL